MVSDSLCIPVRFSVRVHGLLGLRPVGDPAAHAVAVRAKADEQRPSVDAGEANVHQARTPRLAHVVERDHGGSRVVWDWVTAGARAGVEPAMLPYWPRLLRHATTAMSATASRAKAAPTRA